MELNSSAHPLKIQIEDLLNNRKIPENGWNQATIEYLLSYLSLMDSNNFVNKASVGEREGRCFSNIVAKRNYHFTHGIGRSGDLTEPQPKAAGSSILYKLTNLLLKDLDIYDHSFECLLIPLPIGLTLSLCTSSFRSLRRNSEYVIWFGGDEITSKSINNAGAKPIILNTTDAVGEDTLKKFLFENMEGVTLENIICLISSTDSTHQIINFSKFCKNFEIPHIIINEVVREKATIELINNWAIEGKIDVILQNIADVLPVPNGSTLVNSPHVNTIRTISQTYPGRASSSSVIDVFIAILSLGKVGYSKLLDNKQETVYVHEELSKLKERHKDYIQQFFCNHITFGLSFTKDTANFSELRGQIASNTALKVYLVTSLEEQRLLKHKLKAWGVDESYCSIPYIIFKMPLHLTKSKVDYVLKEFDIFLSNLYKN